MVSCVPCFVWFFPTCQVRVVRFYISPISSSASSASSRTSTTTIQAQCSLPDLNRELQTQVFPAGPQPQPSAPSVPCRTSTASSRPRCFYRTSAAQCSCRTSTATSRPKCSLPDLNHCTRPKPQSQTQSYHRKHNHKHSHTTTSAITNTRPQTHYRLLFHASIVLSMSHSCYFGSRQNRCD